MLIRVWDKRPRLTGLLIGLQIAFGLLIAILINAQLLFQPLNLASGDRTDETRGWPELVANLRTVAETNGARWIATSGGYALTGELATYSLFAGSRLPVRQIDSPQRWDFLPPLAADAAAGPALLVSNRPEPPETIATQALGSVTRSDRYGPIGEYWLFLATNPPATPHEP